jgi:hypothetical protein
VLSGPAGNIVLKPKLDPDLVRSPPPATVQSGQLDLGAPPGAALADASWQPLAETPIAVGNLSAATPVQTQSYPYYFPEYYGGYDQYYPSYDYYRFPFPYLVYAVPTRVDFRFGFFRHHGGLLRGGFVRGSAFHGGGPGGRRGRDLGRTYYNSDGSRRAAAVRNSLALSRVCFLRHSE